MLRHRSHACRSAAAPAQFRRAPAPPPRPSRRRRPRAWRASTRRGHQRDRERRRGVARGAAARPQRRRAPRPAPPRRPPRRRARRARWSPRPAGAPPPAPHPRRRRRVVAPRAARGSAAVSARPESIRALGVFARGVRGARALVRLGAPGRRERRTRGAHALGLVGAPRARRHARARARPPPRAPRPGELRACRAPAAAASAAASASARARARSLPRREHGIAQRRAPRGGRGGEVARATRFSLREFLRAAPRRASFSAGLWRGSASRRAAAISRSAAEATARRLRRAQRGRGASLLESRLQLGEVRAARRDEAPPPRGPSAVARSCFRRAPRLPTGPRRASPRRQRVPASKAARARSRTAPRRRTDPPPAAVSAAPIAAFRCRPCAVASSAPFAPTGLLRRRRRDVRPPPLRFPASFAHATRRTASRETRRPPPRAGAPPRACCSATRRRASSWRAVVPQLELPVRPLRSSSRSPRARRRAPGGLGQRRALARPHRLAPRHPWAPPGRRAHQEIPTAHCSGFVFGLQTRPHFRRYLTRPPTRTSFVGRRHPRSATSFAFSFSAARASTRGGLGGVSRRAGGAPGKRRRRSAGYRAAAPQFARRSRGPPERVQRVGMRASLRKTPAAAFWPRPSRPRPRTSIAGAGSRSAPTRPRGTQRRRSSGGAAARVGCSRRVERGSAGGHDARRRP